MQHRPVTRREAIKAASGLAALGGLGGLGLYATDTVAGAEIQLETIDLEGVETTLDANEQVQDLRLRGGIKAKYTSPGTKVRGVRVKADLGRHDGNDGGVTGGESLTKTNEHADVSAHEGTLTSNFDFSLIEDWVYTTDDLNPAPGETVDLSFILIVFVDVFGDGSSEPIAKEAWENYGDVKISRPANGGEPDVQFSGEFSLTVETDG